MKKTVGIFAIVLVLVIGVALGFYFGQERGEQQAEDKLKPLIDRVFPPPPEVMHAISGIVQAVYGAIIDLEVIDPDDYLPHTDGSPQARELRFASVSGATEIVLIDYTNPQPNGRPTTSPLDLSDISEGDVIRVISEDDVRDAKKFDVTRVEVIKY